MISPRILYVWAILDEGDVFGEMGLIDERPRSLTARAISKTELSSVTRDEFVELMQQKPDEALKYLRMFFERLRAMNMRASDSKDDAGIAPAKKEFEVTIFPLTLTAEAFLPKIGKVIERKTFRVGRNSNRHEDPLEINNLILQDVQPYNVSRNHFSVETTDDAVFIQDRGSFLGTLVNGEMIGGHHHGAVMKLREGENEVIAGSHHSPFKFNIRVRVI